MYWYKRSIVLAGVVVAFVSSCRPEVKSGGPPKYFPLKDYFTNEAVRMAKRHSTVFKTVNYNNQPEQKSVVVKNWKRELALFSESDIDKPAWRDSYHVTLKNDSTIYTAVGTDLRTRNVLIVVKAGKVKLIEIRNFTKNLLYQTADHLVYYPDSLYRIEKHQSIKILGTNNYQITGKLK